MLCYASWTPLIKLKIYINSTYEYQINEDVFKKNPKTYNKCLGRLLLEYFSNILNTTLTIVLVSVHSKDQVQPTTPDFLRPATLMVSLMGGLVQFRLQTSQISRFITLKTTRTLQSRVTILCPFRLINQQQLQQQPNY